MSEEAKPNVKPMSKQKQNQILQKQKQLEQKQNKKLSAQSSGGHDDVQAAKLSTASLKPSGHENKQRSRSDSIGENKNQQREKGIASNQNAGTHSNQSMSKAGVTGGSQAPQKHRRHIALFDHLQKKHASQPSNSCDSIECDKSLHPATIKLGLLFRLGHIREDDDRVAALLAGFMVIIKDYRTPPNKSLSWDLDKHIRAQVQHLVDCRPHSMGMGNVIKYVRYAVSSVSSEASEAHAKQTLLNQIAVFNDERIVFARESIVTHTMSAIRDQDVILTFGSSPLVRQVLLGAASVRSFRVVVVDSRPLCDGVETLHALSPTVPCVYTSLAGAANLMRDVSRVVLGASALLANGAVVAPAGTAMVAALAKYYHIPVIVLAESYKFCDKVQLDAIVFNELGSAAELVCEAPTSEGEEEREREKEREGEREKEKKIKYS
mmetsp:Transcript_6920/g.7163  ORF Transcript_6920/g.7163 Transcript_6920/m.7163 type:complete len:435 (+) Transcript_6920:175-1479(+)